MTGADRAEVNRFLQRHGFGELSDRGLLPQLALCIEDETTLKRILNLTAPEERTTCYEALRPFLRFVPRPLDVLLSEIAMDAEIRQLPVITENGGLRAFNVPEVQSAVDKAMATGTLELMCGRCTFAQQIPAISREFAMQLALEQGWTQKAAVLRCPTCSELLGMPAWKLEVQYAVDTETGSTTSIEGLTTDAAAAGQDEGRVTPGPVDGQEAQG